MTRPDTRITVLYGGPSAEAEVSRSSAEGVTGALRETYHDVQLAQLVPSLTRSLLDDPPDVVFPVLHGPPGEDGRLLVGPLWSDQGNPSLSESATRPNSRLGCIPAGCGLG